MTHRSDEPGTDWLRSYLAELDRGGRARRLELSRLDRAGTAAQLVGILGAAPPAELVEVVFARSEGNPFFTEELLAAVRAGSSTLPATLGDLLRSRLIGLPDPSIQVLAAVAVAGRPVPHRLLAAVTGLDDAALLAGLRAAVGRRLLVVLPDTDEYEVRHALLREVVAADLLPGERVRLHARFAVALTGQPELAAASPAVSAAELAAHWDAAGEPDRALPARVAAGLAAADAHAFAEAAGHYRRALELWARLPVGRAGGLDRVDLLGRAAEAAALSGATDHAIGLLEQALDGLAWTVEPVRAAVLLGRLGFHRFRADAEADALAAYEEAERLLAGAPPSAERARVLAGHGLLLMLTLRTSEAIPVCEEAIAVAHQAGAGAEEADALDTLACCLVDQGDLERSLRLHREARRRAETAGADEIVVRTYINLTVSLELAGREREGTDDASEGLERARRLGLEGAWGSVVAGNLADGLLQGGRWAACDRLTGELLAGDSWGASRLHAARGGLLTRRGDFPAARAQLDRSLELSPEAFSDIVWLWLAELALWEGHHDDAEAAVAQGLRWCAQRDPEGKLPQLSAPWYPLALRLAADRAEHAAASRAAGEVAEARRWAAPVVSALERLAEQVSPTPFPPVNCSLLLASAERSPTGRPVRPGAVAGGRGRLGTAGTAVRGRLRPLPAGRGAPGRPRAPRPGRDHARSGTPDGGGAGGGAAAARDRAARPTRPHPPGGPGRPDGGARGTLHGHLPRPDPPRDRGSCAGCGGPDQPADRPGAVHHPQDRQPPRLPHPCQAGRHRPRRGGRDRPPPWAGQAVIPGRAGPGAQHAGQATRSGCLARSRP